ncbi:MAG TPA: lactonase family protein [Tepidisphaeraceae bacterium]|nr:lactonase family protein [Tepidisphaeraceae bacterium]
MPSYRLMVAYLTCFFSWVLPCLAQDQPLPLYVGTYTGPKSQGIYLLHLNPTTGQLDTPVLAAQVPNPTFLTIHPQRSFLYAISEIGSFAGKPAGAVSAFAIDPQTGQLRLLNQQSSGGPGPCFITLDPTGGNVLVANYGGGSVAALPLLANGQLDQPSAFIQHQGSGPNPKRQEGPHAHSINLSPDGRYAFAADLGLDKVLIYQFDPAQGTLTPHTPPAAPLPPGSGPRHFTFHPNGQFAYVINELASTVTAFTYDAKLGRLTPMQTLPTLPADFKGENATAEVQIHPSGKFLYGSNRSHDSLAIFALDPQTGKLTAIGHQSTQGRWPRNFTIDPSGRFGGRWRRR